MTDYYDDDELIIEDDWDLPWGDPNRDILADIDAWKKREFELGQNFYDGHVED